MTTRQVAIRVKTDGKAEVQRDFRDVGKAGSDAYRQIGDASDDAARAADRQMEKWKQLARAAKEAENRDAQQAKFNAALGVGGAGGKSARDSAAVFEQMLAEQAANTNAKVASGAGMSRMMRQTMIYTASDVFASAASGMSPAMIAMQQGPQVLQAIALEGGAASASMLKLVAIFGTVAGVSALATTAWLANKDAMAALEVTAQGLGATAGLTGAQIDRLALKTGAAAGLTVGASREMASAYLSTGRIGGEVTGKLISLTQRYAVVTGQDAKTATKELATALADPAKGMEALNGKLRFLDDSTVRYIRTLLEQNRVTEAQVVLADKLGDRLASTADHVTTLGGAWDVVKQKASQAWSVMGKAVDFLAQNKTDVQRLAELDSLRALRPKTGTGQLTRVAPAWWAAEDKEAAEIRARLQRARQAAEEQRLNGMADDARAVQDRVNPNAAKLRALRQDRAVLQGALDAGALSDTKQAKTDLAALDKEITALAHGYKSAGAEASALARAQRAAAAEARKAAAAADKDAREDTRLSELKARNLLTVLRLKLGARGDYDQTGLQQQIEDLEREARLHQMIAEFVSAGVERTEAMRLAQRQLSDEMQAGWQGMLSDVSKPIDGLISTDASNAKLAQMKLITDGNAQAAESMKWAYVSAFDQIADALASSADAWSSWKDLAGSAIRSVLSEAIKLAILNPIKNALFGGMTGWVPLPSFSFGRNADGTDYWRGGMTWVGERGPELVNLPRGSQVFSAPQSQAMAGGAPSVSIVLNAQGAGPNEVEALKSEMAGLKRALPSLIVQVSNDARQRRLIRG